MSEPQRTDDHRLIDWLYGELGDEERVRFEAELERDPQLRAQAEELSQTRSMLSELEDAEPPSALSSFLLHAAAIEVQDGKSDSGSGGQRRGLFGIISSALASLAARPALAAAAALVVVVGVAGALYSTGNLESTADQPSVVSTEADEVAPDPAGTAAGATGEAATRDDAKREMARLDEEQESPAAPSQEQEPPSDTAFADQPDRKADVAGAETRNRMEKAATESKRAGKGSRSEGARDRERLSKKKAKKPRSTRSDKSVAQGSAGAVGGAPPPQTNAISGGDPSAAEGYSYGRGLGAVGDSAPARPYYAGRKALDDTWAKEQETNLMRVKDCKRAAEIANDIRDRHPEYYARNIASSKPVRRCTYFVKKERNERQRIRARKGGGSGKATAAPRRQKRSAPAREAADDAYEAESR